MLHVASTQNMGVSDCPLILGSVKHRMGNDKASSGTEYRFGSQMFNLVVAVGLVYLLVSQLRMSKRCE